MKDTDLRPADSVHSDGKDPGPAEAHTACNAAQRHGSGHHHRHDHGVGDFRKMEQRKLVLSLTITVSVMTVEIVGGIISGSIALISDAGHMFTHVFALGIALLAIIAVAQSPCHHRTFGLVRAEILAAFVNSLFLLLMAVYIIYESALRFFHPQEILGRHMLLVAVLGLIANVASIWILKGSRRQDINIRGVVLHLLADALSSVAIVLGAIVIYYTNWVVVDPIISIGISLLIMVWGLRLLKESSRILLQEAPAGLDSHVVAEDIVRRFPVIERVEYGRLWMLTVDRLIYTAHVSLKEGALADEFLLDRVACYLNEKYNIVETTLQVVRS